MTEKDIMSKRDDGTDYLTSYADFCKPIKRCRTAWGSEDRGE